jgi:hypothetical protein
MPEFDLELTSINSSKLLTPQAFVRQTNLLSRHVADGERSVVEAVRSTQRNDLTAALRLEDDQVCVCICA